MSLKFETTSEVIRFLNDLDGQGIIVEDEELILDVLNEYCYLVDDMNAEKGETNSE